MGMPHPRARFGARDLILRGYAVVKSPIRNANPEVVDARPTSVSAPSDQNAPGHILWIDAATDGATTPAA